MQLKNNPSVLKEYEGSYGVYYIQFLSKQFWSYIQTPFLPRQQRYLHENTGMI